LIERAGKARLEYEASAPLEDFATAFKLKSREPRLFLSGWTRPYNSHMSEKDQPRISHAFENWRESDLPFVEKIAVSTRNQLKKLVTRKHCCGNYGEPGC
jgi:hypothetical protein